MNSIYLIISLGVISSILSHIDKLRFFNWLPEVAGIFIYCGISIINKNYILRKNSIFLIVICSFQILFQLLYSENTASIIILRFVIIYLLINYLLLNDKSEDIFNGLIKLTNTVYYINILFIILECILIQYDYSFLINYIYGGEYKSYSNGVEPFTAVPSSLYNEYQASSQLLVISSAWFFSRMLYQKSNNQGINKLNIIFFIINIIILLNYHTTTALYLFIFLFALIIYFQIGFNIVIIGSIGFLLSYYFDQIYFKLLYKIDTNIVGSDDYPSIYKEAFYNPIKVALENINLLDLWLGIDSAKFQHGDFGLGIIAIQSGIIFSGLIIFIFLFYLLRIICFIYLNKKSINHNWNWFLFISAIITLANFISTFHYIPALQTGGLELFAFHLAVTTYSFSICALPRR